MSNPVDVDRDHGEIEAEPRRGSNVEDGQPLPSRVFKEDGVLYKESVRGRKLRCNRKGLALKSDNAPCLWGISAELWAMLSEHERQLLRAPPPPAPDLVADAMPAPSVTHKTPDPLGRYWKMIDLLEGRSTGLWEYRASARGTAKAGPSR